MDLQKLMDLPGALAAFTYTDKGDLQSHLVREGTELTAQVLDLLSRSCVAHDTWMRPGMPCDSMQRATFTVSPHRS